MKINKYIRSVIFLLLITTVATIKTYAVCPVCTVAVGVGVGLSRWLGIDDSVTGLWVGALVISMSLWTTNWLATKKIKFKFIEVVTIIAYYLFIFVPMYKSGFIGHPLNKIWGVDKLLYGTVVGSAIFIFSVFLDKYLRTKNNGKVYIYYQKVIIPVGLLLIFSVFFYLITK